MGILRGDDGNRSTTGRRIRHRLAREGLAPMPDRGRCRTDTRGSAEDPKLHGNRLLERGANVFWLSSTSMRATASHHGKVTRRDRLVAVDWPPRRRTRRRCIRRARCARRLMKKRIGLVATDRPRTQKGAVFLPCVMPRRPGEHFSDRGTPAQEIDTRSASDVAEQFAPRPLRRVPRGFQPRERLEPSAIVFGRSVISPTPTMTGIRFRRWGI